MRSKLNPCVLIPAMLSLIALTSVFAQVGPDIDSIRANQKAAAEARQKEQTKEQTNREAVRQDSEQRLRTEIRSENAAATQAATDTNTQLQSDVIRLRAELSDAKKTIDSLTSERDQLRRSLEATTRPVMGQ